MDTVKSDGGTSSYYELPEGAKDLMDLIEHKDMSFSVANIFKAAYRLGEKDGSDKSYDVRKIIWFAERLLKEYSEAWVDPWGQIELDLSEQTARVAGYLAGKKAINPNEAARQDEEWPEPSEDFTLAEQIFTAIKTYPAISNPYPGGYDD
jgi:hypothetical protein